VGLFKKKKTVVAHNIHNLMGEFENRQKFLPAIIVKGVLGQQNLGSHIIGEYTNGQGLKYRRIPKQSQKKGLTSFLQPVPFSVTSFNHDQFVADIKNYLTSVHQPKVVEVISADNDVLDEYDYGFHYLALDKTKHYLLDYEFQVNYNTTTSVLEYSFIDPVSNAEYHPEVHIPVPPLLIGVPGIFVVYRTTKESIPPVQVQIGSDSGTSHSTYPIPPSNVILDSANAVNNYDPTTDIFYLTLPWVSNNVEFKKGDIVDGVAQPTFGFYIERYVEDLQFPNVETDPNKPPKTGEPSTMLSWAYDHKRTFTYGYEVEFPLSICYPIGTGIPALDSIAANASSTVSTASENWFPVFPLRIDHQLAQTLIPNQYKIIKRLCKKLGINLKKIMKQYQDHDEWDKMSYIFIRFGVGINGHNKNRSNIAEYLFRFFFKLGLVGEGNNTSKVIAYNNALALYKAQMEARANNPEDYIGVPLPTPPAPIGVGQVRKFEQRYTRPNLGYDVKYLYNGIRHFTGTGKYKPDLKPRYYRVYAGKFVPVPVPDNSNVPGSGSGVPGWVDEIKKNQGNTSSFIIVHQVTDNFYEGLEISNLEEKVFILGKYALNAATQPQQDDSIGKPYFESGKDSELIIPMLPSILKECGMVSYTQIATEGVWGSIHTYQKVKVKRGWVRWALTIIAIVLIIVASFYDYSGTSQSAIYGGLIAAGASTAVAIVLTVIVKIVIAAIISAILSKVAVKLFGPKWGGLIAMIATVVISAYAGGGSFNLAQFTTAPNLISMAGAVAQGYGEHYKLKSEQIMEEMKSYSKESQEVWDEIYQQMYEETSTIDSRTMMEIMRRISDYESHDAFLQRTLMTGSDIADATAESISSFVDSTLVYPT